MLSPHRQNIHRDEIKMPKESQLTPQTHPNSQRKTISPVIADINLQYQQYCRFKKQLLQAMCKDDPLAILQSGIFQEYEQTFTRDHHLQSPFRRPLGEISQFEPDESITDTKLSRYEVSRGIRVIQVEGRSRSCQRLTRQERAIKRLEKERNVQFVLFINAMKELRQKETFQNVEDGKDMKNTLEDFQLQTSQTMEELLQKEQNVENVLKQKKQLEAKLQECLVKLEHEKNININDKNARKDKELEFLLKEKQMNKKLQEAREQIDHLRQMLQSSPQKPSFPQQIPKKELVQNEENRLTTLKERVATEGRLRWALSKAWGAELQSKCQ